MAEKDITTRDLVNKPDVFADIVNGSIFFGERRFAAPCRGCEQGGHDRGRFKTRMCEQESAGES